MMEKRCFIAGCQSRHPNWGFGTVRAGTIKWACDAHRRALWEPKAPAPPAAKQADLFGNPS
jgi:hypothetical protein